MAKGEIMMGVLSAVECHFGFTECPIMRCIEDIAYVLMSKHIFMLVRELVDHIKTVVECFVSS